MYINLNKSFLYRINKLEGGTMENFNVEFSSSEKQFIFKFGVNKGYTISYNKVNRCLFLSSGAKQLYQNLCSHAMEEDSFPTQAMLRLELGWSRQTLNLYLNELKEYGFIVQKSNGKNKPAIYELVELHNIPLLIHSELVYGFIKEYNIVQTDVLDKMYQIINKYKKSALFKEVQNSTDILSFKDKIYSYFYAHLFDMEVKEEKIELQSRADINNKVSIPLVWDLGMVERENEERPKKRKVKHYNDVPLEEWNTNHFCYYFADKYKEKFDVPYIVTNADRGAMKRLLDEKPKELIKQYIEIFLKEDYFEIKTIKGFASSFVQSVLDRYIKFGRLPSYKNNESKIQEKDEGYVPEDYFKRVPPPIF